MKWDALLLVSFLQCLILGKCSEPENSKIVCYYNSVGYRRPDMGQYHIMDLERAVGDCTHLVYGFADIGRINMVISNDPALDLDIGRGNYRAVTDLKKKFPDLKVLLSVGGFEFSDILYDTKSYMNVLKSPLSAAFINSVRNLMYEFNFDGIDLAWRFPLMRIKPRRGWEKIWYMFGRTIGFTQADKDQYAHKRKGAFATSVQDLKNALKNDSLLVTISVLPHVNYTLYYIPDRIADYVDGIHLLAFDFSTAEKKITPDKADYPAPIFATGDRDPQFSVDHMVSWFLNSTIPANKIILGIPTYGRVWNLRSPTPEGGTPPLKASGSGPKGYLTHMKGVWSQAEICRFINEDINSTKVQDPTNELGVYAYRPRIRKTHGVWVGFEDSETVATKVAYARSKGLGGVAVVDLTMDDARGYCGGERYPILKAAKKALGYGFASLMMPPAQEVAKRLGKTNLLTRLYSQNFDANNIATVV